MNKNYSLENLPEIASEIITSVKNKTLLFYGEMGVGVLDNISSPTFSLVNEYQTSKEEKVFHFDFYRITDEEEALDMGIEDYLYNNDWCLIEWPQNVENLLPLESVEIHLSTLENGQRSIQLK